MDASTSSADPCEFLPTYPSTNEMLDNMATVDYVLVPVCTVMSAVTLAIFLSEVYFTNKHFNGFESRRRKTLVVLALFPVYSLTSLTTIWVPRSVIITELVAASYLSYTVYTCLHLVADYYGGRERMIEMLNGRKLTRHPQTLLCSRWKPPVVFTRNYFFRTKILVLQFAVVRPLFGYFIAVMWTNGSFIPGSTSIDSAAFWISLLMFVSILINLYGMVIFMGVVSANLPEYHIKPKYLGVQLTLLTTFFISAIISVCAGQGAIPCRPPFSVEARASRLNHYILVIEMLLFCILGRYGFLRKIEYSDGDMNDEKPKAELGVGDMTRENSQTVLVVPEVDIVMETFPEQRMTAA